MISGVYVPLLTPFDHQGTVDTWAYGAFAQWLVSRGVDGVVPFGSTGEGPSLSLRERIRKRRQRTAGPTGCAELGDALTRP